VRPSRIAVIGTGIAGMASAWLLAHRHQVTVYEADGRIGGHTNTVLVDDPHGPVAVDTGFIVYNRENYPLLDALFRTLGVATRAGDMSFAVSADGGALEYSGSSLDGLFGQRRNLLRPAFHRMLLDILRFNAAARRLARDGGDASQSLAAFFESLRLGSAVRDRYLLPMAAAIWSCPVHAMLDFPALPLARFFDNHGLLALAGRPQWRTVCGGSASYVRALTAPFVQRIRIRAAVATVTPAPAGVRVCGADGHAEHYDQAVIATHADQARAMLCASDPRRALLASFRYQDNRAVLHRDPALMPRRRRVWSSWNHLSERGADGARVSVSYWMNRLQGLDCRQPYIVSLNPLREPARGALLAEFDYAHPVFDAAAMMAQQRLPAANGSGRIWLAGSYLGYGFHEDALRSAVAVARRLGVAPPWEAAGEPGAAPAAPARAARLPQGAVA